jgi:ribulose-5-phosphate 4-epimerase/fuculose-1-phosphate aldolase
MSVPLSPRVDLPTLRAEAALACRLLAMEGLADGAVGDVSVRVGPDRMLVRCRGPHERGMLRTGSDDIRLTSLDGSLDPGDGYTLPDELALHGEILGARPDAGAVVLVHPRAVLLCGLAGLPLRLRGGVGGGPPPAAGPVLPWSSPVRTPQLAAEVLEAMGDASLSVLGGHGIAVVGATLEQAVVRAVDLNMAAEAALDTAAVGGDPGATPRAGLVERPVDAGWLDEVAAWRALAAKAVHRGL